MGEAEEVLGVSLAQMALAAPAPVAPIVQPDPAPDAPVAQPAPAAVFEEVEEIVEPPKKTRAAKPAAAPVETSAVPSNDEMIAALGL